MKNLRDVFTIKEDVKDKTILLIDDVTTSGATLEECGKALRKGGAKRVYALVWAHELKFS